jgi:putative FmdB family regulatory protein
MPIYEYRCAACGFQKEYLQKMSDAPLTDCPECGKASLNKMVTAAGFQLKGSGWYVTDFKQGAKPSTGVAGKTADANAKTDSKPDAKADATGSVASTESKPAADTAVKKSESSAPAAGSGGSSTAGT